MVRGKTLFLCITGIIFLLLMQGWSDAYTFSTNSVGALSTIKITDMSGSLPSSGSAITVNAWDASGNALTQSSSATPLTLKNYATISITGTALAAMFQGTPMLYTFTINSSMTVIANVKKSADGLLNFPITFMNGLSNFAVNTVGPLSTIKITDMSGSLPSSGSAITVNAWDASGTALTQSASATSLILNNYATASITGTALAAMFTGGTPMTYQFAVPSTQYIFTNVKNSTDGTLNINVPTVFPSGTTNYCTNSVGSLSTLKITDMSGSLSSSGAAITVSAWDASGNPLTQSASAPSLTLSNYGTKTIRGTDLAARFTGGTPMTYEFTVGSSQYIITNVKGSTDGSTDIPTVFPSGTNNFTTNSVDPGDTIKVSDLSGSLGSSGAAITVSAWDAGGNALTQSGSASSLVLLSNGTTTITGSALAARFTGGTPAAYQFSVASSNYLITTVKSTAGGTLNIPNIVYIGSTATKYPRFAYAANQNDGTISIYTVNADTGQLRHNGYAAAGSEPYSVTVEPSGKFAYAANSGDNIISVYTINQTTGALTAGTPVAAGTQPYSVTVDPSGKFAYAANQVDNTISVYTINQTTGALTAGTPVAAGTQPYSVTVDPSGKFAYVANSLSGTISVYTINQTTGALTAGTPVATGQFPNSVTVDPSGKFAYTANSGDNTISVYTINQTTGALTAGTPVANGTTPQSVTVDPTGKFAYTANIFSYNISVYTIDRTTGALTAQGTVAAGTQPLSVTVDPTGKFAYAANNGDNTISVYTLNQTTGALTAAGTVSARSGPRSMAMVSGATAVTYVPKFAYAANCNSSNISVYTIDQATGALTAGTAVAAGTCPISVAVDPSGKFAYAANWVDNNISVFLLATDIPATLVCHPSFSRPATRPAWVEPVPEAWMIQSGRHEISSHWRDNSRTAST